MSELANYALKFVTKSGAGFVFVTGARRGLAMAFDDLFRTGRETKKELSALLKLGWMFETKHASPGIGRAIISWIVNDARAVAALGIRSGKHAAALRRQFARLAGQIETRAAPVHGADAPVGTVKLRSFMTPGREMRRAPKAARVVQAVQQKLRPPPVSGRRPFNFA